MSGPLLLVENLLSVAQFPSHVLAATEEPSGHEAFRVADGRRSSLDYATASTANALWELTVAFDRVRAFDMLVLDRGHNLAGLELQLLVSDTSDYSSVETICDVTVPDGSAAGSVDDANGVVTEEGAWAIRFDLHAGMYAKLAIPAMGAGLVPQLVGAWLGLSLQLDDLPLNLARDLDGNDLTGQAMATDLGWVGRGPSNVRRAGTLGVRLGSDVAYDPVRYHVLGHFARNRPAWIWLDPGQGDQAVCAVRAEGTLRLPQTPEWIAGRMGSFGWVEHEPAVP